MLNLYSDTAMYSVLLPEVKELLNELVSDYYIHPTNKEVLSPLALQATKPAQVA